jgi:hypothetical protein
MIALHDSMSLGRFRFLENNGSPDWAEFSLIERSKDSPERGPDGDSRTPPPHPPDSLPNHRGRVASTVCGAGSSLAVKWRRNGAS